jgi:hypothetical protein
MKYTKELLEEILQEGNAKVLEEYKRYSQRTRIKFRCECGEETEKKFEMLNVYRYPYCGICSLKKKAEKYEKTCLDKYGVKNAGLVAEVKEKIQNSFDKNFGGHPKKNKEVQEKWKQTCLDKYGGHPNQNREVQIKAEKNSYKFKTFTFPSGKTVKYQGYEDKAINELLKTNNEDDIIVGRGEVPIIPFNTVENDKTVKHKYFPDIFIPSENKIIEVKSEWTIKLKRSYICEKGKGVIDSGYKFEVWLFDSHGKSCKKLGLNELDNL